MLRLIFTFMSAPYRSSCAKRITSALSVTTTGNSSLPRAYADAKEKIFVHYSGLDLSEYAFRAGPRSPRQLLSVGRFVPTKGFDTLIDAVAMLRQRGIDCSAVIVGDGPERSALSRQIQRLGLEGIITLDQWRTPEEVRQRMWSCTALVQASRGIGDATPTVIKEAIATGTPVIATAQAGIPELLNFGRCGALVPEGSPSALADAIAAYLSDSRLREEIAAKARAYAEDLLDQHRNGRALAQRLRSCHQVLA